MAPIANNKDGNAGAEVIDSPTQHVTQDKTKENNAPNHPKKNDAPNNNTSNNEQHAHQLNDDTDEEFRHKRAHGRWNFVKGLCNRHADLEHKTLFKSGEKISLTTAEATFLNMMTQSKLNGNNEKQSVSSVLSGESSSSAATRRKSHFLDAVKAAVAKERLRDSLAERLAHLSGPEVKFLTKLVNNEDVSLGALENAVHVLDNDPIYNPTLRSADEEEEEEKEVKDGVLSGNGSITSFSEKTEDRRNQFKRRSSLIEKSMWKISTYGMDEATGNDEGSIGSERLSVSVNDRRSKFNRKSSHHEKSMWDISTRGKYSKQTAPEKESMQGNASGVKTNFQAVGEDGAATKKSSKDGTVDDQPMEPTMANEAEQKLDSRDEKNEGSIKLVGLDELLSSLREKMSSSSSLKSEKVKAPQKITMDRYSFLCCGLESMSFGERNDLEKPEDDLIHNAEDDADADSLESKKRFLHLKTTDTVGRHEHLSTWLGSPDDYPILGLKTKAIDHDDDDNDVEEEEEDVEEHDPLDPHVLSPLLMKCLRDHLPYALREENFWLKYSLVRDGASMEAIFSALRHSQHSVLAIETSEGEVFGTFTSTPWRSNGNNYYGSCEAFVWMLRKPRRNTNGEESCSSLDEYILRESSLEVFPWNHKGNRNVQLSNNRKLFVGGGEPEEEVMENVEAFRDNGSIMRGGESKQWGMALALDKELLNGTSSCCATFDSNPLIDSARHEGSGVFQIMNMEIWALTPCMSEDLAEELELGRTFVTTGFVDRKLFS